jgi:hypothetical protein
MDSLSEASPSASDTTSPRLISGGRALTIFLLLIAVVGGILLLTRKEHASVPPPTNHHQTETFALTDSQAISTFKQLKRLSMRAYVQRDPSLIPLATISDSPAGRTALREIHQLRVDGVFPKPNFVTRRLTVTENSESIVRIRQILRYDLRFVDQRRRDVTTRNRPQIQTVVWTLKPVETGRWRIFDAVITTSRAVGG